MKDNVLYLETDEEITSAIDKMLALPGGSVSIVVPKRSALLQSIVNLKLLKKAADGAGKELVLVTGDKTSAHLASRVGLAVAPNLNAAPVLTAPPVLQPEVSEDIVEGVDEPEKPSPEDLSPIVAARKTEPRKGLKASLPFLNRSENTKAAAAPTKLDTGGIEPSGVAMAEASSGRKTPTVPNFDNLQKRAVMGGALLIGALAILASTFFLSKAEVTLYAQGTKVKANFDFKIDTESKESDPDNGIVAGEVLTLSKDLKVTVEATGTKDVGTKAEGTMQIKNETGVAQPLVEGTRFVKDGKTFLSKEDVTVPAGSLGPLGNVVAGTATVDVVADAAGDSYNLAPGRYSIPGLPPEKQAKIYGTGSQMSGGTTKQVKVVTQTDIDKAKASLLESSGDAAKKDITSKAGDDYEALEPSFAVKIGEATAVPGLGEESETVEVTLTADYQMLALKKEDFKEMVRTQELKEAGEDGQVYDEGIKDAIIVPAKASIDNRMFTFTGEAYTGKKIDTERLKEELAGERYGEAIKIAGREEGVQRVDVKMNPSWLPRLPKLAKNITVDIKVAGIE